MIWIGFLVEAVLFYLLALLQNSFFLHFFSSGAVPNLVFILFFVLLFFGKKNIFYLFFLAVFAGIFLDIFLVGYFGTSVAILFIIGMLAKIIQTSLKEGDDNHSFIFFICIFILAQTLYNLILLHSFSGLILSALTASLLFFIIKKFKLEKFLK